jgi:translation initiation factor IF-1
VEDNLEVITEAMEYCLLLVWDHLKKVKIMAKKKKNGWDSSGQKQEERDDVIVLQGTIEEALPGTLFNVLCDNSCRVLCTLSGKMRMNHIKILPGDKVTIEVSPYDCSRGRVKWRSR